MASRPSADEQTDKHAVKGAPAPAAALPAAAATARGATVWKKSLTLRAGMLVSFVDAVFVLKIKCELDNVASMQADENNKWILTMQSPDEGERREHVEVTRARNEELDGSRGTANFVVKWQGAKKQATANIVEIKKVTTNGLIKGDQSGEYVPVLALDCRGLEPIEWHPSTDFVVTSEGGTVYESDAVDLSEEDWTEYCEKSSAPVSIMEIEHKFEVA